MQDTRIQSLGQEDPLEGGMATHSSILAWRLLWTEEPGGLKSVVSQGVGHHWPTNTFFSLDFGLSRICVSFFRAALLLLHWILLAVRQRGGEVF